MNEEVKQIEQLFPSGKEVTLKGKVFNIKPFGFGKFPKVLKLLKDMKDVASTDATLASVDVPTLVMENADVVVEFAILATGEKKEFFDDLPLDEAVELLQAIIEVNADFFVKRLQPKLLTALSKLSESVGGLSSQGSSQPATA